MKSDARFNDIGEIIDDAAKTSSIAAIIIVEGAREMKEDEKADLVNDEVQKLLEKAKSLTQCMKMSSILPSKNTPNSERLSDLNQACAQMRAAAFKCKCKCKCKRRIKCKCKCNVSESNASANTQQFNQMQLQMHLDQMQMHLDQIQMHLDQMQMLFYNYVFCVQQVTFC